MFFNLAKTIIDIFIIDFIMKANIVLPSVGGDADFILCASEETSGKKGGMARSRQ